MTICRIVFLLFCREENCALKNLVNLGQSSTHYGPNCPDYIYQIPYFYAVNFSHDQNKKKILHNVSDQSITIAVLRCLFCSGICELHLQRHS